MRIWITQLDEIDTGEVDGDGDPITVSRPRGLVGDGGVAVWPVVDDDDEVQVVNGQGVPMWVALAKDMDVAPTFGRDFGDPTVVTELQDSGELDEFGEPIMRRVVVSPFHTVPLSRTALDTIEDWVSLDRGELDNTTTRAEALRAITQDQNAVIGCTWGADKVGARVWLGDTERVRTARRGEMRAWLEGLPQPQRQFFRSLTRAQKRQVAATPEAERAELLQSWN